MTKVAQNLTRKHLHGKMKRSVRGVCPGLGGRSCSVVLVPAYCDLGSQQPESLVYGIDETNDDFFCSKTRHVTSLKSPPRRFAGTGRVPPQAQHKASPQHDCAASPGLAGHFTFVGSSFVSFAGRVQVPARMPARAQHPTWCRDRDGQAFHRQIGARRPRP